MEWGWLIIFAMAIVGAAAIAGGIVAYRGSDRTGLRSVGASLIAAGAVMWLIVGLVIPARVLTSGSNEPVVETTSIGPTS